jgi:predicted amidohydrolase
MRQSSFVYTRDDISWAEEFRALYSLLDFCPRSEKAALLLSTCRNAYMTANALFVEIQLLLSESKGGALRGACELMIQTGEWTKIRDYFGNAIRTLREYENKKEVWTERHGIHSEVLAATASLDNSDVLAASRVQSMLKHVRIPPEAIGDGWNSDLLAIDLQDRPHLDKYFESLDKVFSLLNKCAQVGLSVTRFLSTERQQELVLSGNAREDKVGLDVITNLLRELVHLCEWDWEEKGPTSVISIIGNYDRPATLEKRDKVELPILRSLEDVSQSSKNVGFLLREILYYCHAIVCREFEPNVARPPLPAPFQINLPVRGPSAQAGYSSAVRVNRVRCSLNANPPDKVTVGIAALAVPIRCLDLRSYQIKAEFEEKIKRDVRLALKEALAQGCQVIVFPEYSVPRSMQQELMEWARSNERTIVAGMDGDWIDNKLCDKALVAIPGEPKLHFQCKQEPSLEEEAGRAFYRDGQFWLFSNSPIGDFGVVLCSDLFQLSTLQMWHHDAPLPEILFVVARNHFNDLYLSIAKADSMRLYCAVVISNVSETEGGASDNGSCVVVPNRNNQLVKGTDYLVTGGAFINKIMSFQISLHAIRARSRGKPEAGYFAVPYGAKRG